ncbi:hypothetical protein Plec18167_002099 [Paecilomyces lecythidis]|uniref:Uncharacterized protein n=1 Tax=Paecilomyces lecythidis TaxID=3004212 RepID=A0ABR3YAN1_9EURO
MASTPGGRRGRGRGRGNHGRGPGRGFGKATPPVSPLKDKTPARETPASDSHSHPGTAVDMAEYPRQQDIEERNRTLRQEFEKRTREPRHRPLPLPQDLSLLLAAIFKLEKRDGLQVPAPASTQSERRIPEFSPTIPSRRLIEVLDSLATLLVSQPKHEVLAVALRLRGNEQRLELLLSGNAEIQSATRKHLADIWNFMKRLSDRYYTVHKHDPTDDSPTQPANDPEFRQIRDDFARCCMQYTWRRLQHRFNCKVNDLRRLPSDTIAPSHRFHSVKLSILRVVAAFTRELNPEYGKPQDDDLDGWRMLQICLRECRNAIRGFFDEGGFQGIDVNLILPFVKLENYLRKIASLHNSYEILVRAAISPSCRPLFTMSMMVTDLPEVSVRLPQCPQKPEQWEYVLEDALGWYNEENKRNNASTRVMDIQTISKDTAFMAKQDISRTVVLHCEVKLLAAIERAQRQNPKLPKAYTYIGVSKLSCNGCDSFFRAFNTVHNTTWLTKGGHGKSYYPWMFPAAVPKREDVLKATYYNVVSRWVTSYKGYVAQFVPLLSDSRAQSARSTGILGDMDDEISDVVSRLNSILKPEDLK